MLSQERNDEITLVGADRPAGQVLRHYWQPAALSDELVGARPLVPVTLLGEQLILFRDETGRLGLMDRHCPHRGADLCYGRLEDNGVRCPFHGWHFDVTGQCTEQPGEPADSKMYTQIKARSYPVVERNGIIFAYMGPGAPPPLPPLDCMIAPDSHVFAFKGLWECNWLQALEVGIDPAHASFLHRFLEDEDPNAAYGKQFRDRSTDSELTMTEVLRRFPRPDLQVEETAYGMRLTALRDIGGGKRHVRVTNHVFPQAIVIPLSGEMTITQWHVPVDDVSCYWYSMFTSYRAPVDKTTMREQRMKEHELPDYRPKKNRKNNYGYDPDEQRTTTYTGMGLDINVHDQWAVESLGPIQDRTREHLGATDVGITTYRRMLRRAIQNVAMGAPLPCVDFGVAAGSAGLVEDDMRPAAIDMVTAEADWRQAWRLRESETRNAADWVDPQSMSADI